MSYNLLSVTPVGSEFILRVKKLPNFIEKKFGQIEKELFFIKRSIVYKERGDKRFTKEKWFCYPLEPIKEQPVNIFLDLRLSLMFETWIEENYDDKWGSLEDEEKELKLRLNKCKKTTKNLIDWICETNYLELKLKNIYQYDDNLEYQKNGTYKYMHIKTFKKRYKYHKLSRERSDYFDKIT